MWTQDLAPLFEAKVSIFGSLATVFVLLSYLYVSAMSFLIGAEVDAIVRDEWRA